MRFNVRIEMRPIETMSRPIRGLTIGALPGLLIDQRRQSESLSLATCMSPFAGRQEASGELSRRAGVRQAANQFASHQLRMRP